MQHIFWAMRKMHHTFWKKRPLERMISLLKAAILFCLKAIFWLTKECLTGLSNGLLCSFSLVTSKNKAISLLRKRYCWAYPPFLFDNSGLLKSRVKTMQKSSSGHSALLKALKRQMVKVVEVGKFTREFSHGLLICPKNKKSS